MPGVTSYTKDDVLYHEYDLTDPNLDLDVTSDPWNLIVGQASIIRGLDVIHRGRIAPAGLRKPLGSTNPNSSTDVLTMAETADMSGVSSVRYSNVEFSSPSDFTVATSYITNLVSGLFDGSTYAWPSEMVGGYIYIQTHEANARTLHTARITARASTGGNTNDTIQFTPSLSGAFSSNGNFQIVYEKSATKRGIWVTNGRKFWLWSGGAWVCYLDLGSDTYLGETWHICRIAYQIVMFVSDRYPARIIHLSAAQSSGATDNGSLAGLIAPVKPIEIETQGDEDGNTAKSWACDLTVGAGSITGGVYRIMVRAVNLDDGAESEMVPVYDWTDLDDRDLTISASQKAGVGMAGYYGSTTYPAHYAPPYHERWTHIEVWRTTAGGSAYFMETRIPICRAANEIDVFPTQDAYCLVSNQKASCTLSDTALAGQTQATAADLLAGKTPPMCQRAVSLLGVTICAGAAHTTRNDPTAYAHDIFTAIGGGGTSYTNATKRVGQTGLFTAYTAVGTGDKFRVWYPAADAGDYEISARHNDYITLTTELAGSSDRAAGTLVGCIIRPYTIKWPYIASDEEVWYSRTDKYAPESFQIANSDGTSRILRVSSIGDKFKNLVTVGNYACIIMLGGVHLLYFDNGVLVCDAVVTDSNGTPWADSVVVYDNVVLWARPEGVRILQTSNDVDSEGHRARLGWLDPAGKTRQWFEDAYNNGYSIDAGIDSHNGTIRFRRKVDANTFEVLEYSYLNKRWTLIDDDSGAFYARTRDAESTEKNDSLLYSITDQGAIFEVNNFDLTHEYDSATVQGTLDGTYTIDAGGTYIQKAGAFDAKMLGDIIRFKTSSGTETSITRIITAATTDRLTFAAVSGLAAGYAFYVASPRFCIKWAPIVGKIRDAIKTLVGLIVRAMTGPRNHAGGAWSDPPTGAFTLSSYRDYHTTAADTNASEISVFDEGNTGNLSEDRVSALEGQGSAITLQLATEDTRTDFRLELVKAVVQEEADVRSDQSASA